MRPAALVGVLACAAVVAVAVPKGAAAAETHFNCATFDNQGNIVSVVPNCTQTISMQGGGSQSMPGVDPCTGNTGTLTLSLTHQVFHVNVNGASDLWITGTQNGTATFTPDDPTAAVGTGSWAAWFGGSQNNRNGVLHDTFNLQVHFPGGLSATFHMIDHTTLTGTGTITANFSKGSAATGGDCNH
jgi:hypothetical protein